ncbi:MAG: amino acid permease [Candidatus Nanopelagicaceae bacterium]
MAKSWTDGAPTPKALQDHAHLRDPFSYRLKKFLLGNPLNRHTLGHQRLKKRYALGVLSSDPISSSAYGTEQILVGLIPFFGIMAFSLLMPMTGVVLVILTIITLSYRNVISTYVHFGGAYIVARENFGRVTAQIAAVALIIDYIVTLAIQSAAGVAAIISAFPEISAYKLPMVIGIILFLAYGNLRGVKEAGKLFALPTYLFVFSMFTVFGIGIYRDLNGSLPVLDPNQPGTLPLGEEQGLLTMAAIFILLRAFANGGSSLTGLEAISDGVGLFEKPEYKNARRTLLVMATLLGSLVLGVSYFAHKIYAMPYEDESPTVISQVAQAILGDGQFGQIFFLVVQAATMLILFAGANTTFSAFPIVVNYAAQDGYLPRWLTKRGHKLNFSNGILVLSGSALVLVFITGASVSFLVAFYALGVFTAFTISGLGMAKKNYVDREAHWRVKFIINGLAGLVALVVVTIFAIVKFTQGAWFVLLVSPILVVLFLRLHNRYEEEELALKVNEEQERVTSISRHDVTVLVDSVDIATVGTVRYARSLNPRSIHAVHFVLDDLKAEQIKKQWMSNHGVDDVPIEFIDCPDRRLPNAAVDYAIRATQKPDVELTLLLPRRAYRGFLGRLLHDQTAEAIARPISQLPRVVATIVPFDIDKIISGHHQTQHAPEVVEEELKPVVPQRAQSNWLQSTNEISHYEEKVTPIGKISWRKRAHVTGHVTAIRPAAMDSAPTLEVEIWDETGGVTLQFLGRREIAGLEVGSVMIAEGMVGEQNGALTILNPSYEIRV